MRNLIAFLVLLNICACTRQPAEVRAADSQPALAEARQEAESLDAQSLRRRVEELQLKVDERRHTIEELAGRVEGLRRDPAKSLSDAGQALQSDYRRLRAEFHLLEANLEIYADALSKR